MGLKFIRFEDDTFGANRNYLRELCNALQRHCPGLYWSCQSRVNIVDAETMSLMRKPGCYSVSIGIESGNNEILRHLRKGITVEQAMTACEKIKKSGIRVNAFFQIGSTQETEKTLLKTYDIIKKIKCNRLIYSIFTPYPETEAYTLCKNLGLIKGNFDLALYNHQSPMNCFSSQISIDRFRKIASKIEKMVDRKNTMGRFKDIFSISSIRLAQQLYYISDLTRLCNSLIGGEITNSIRKYELNHIKNKNQ